MSLYARILLTCLGIKFSSSLGIAAVINYLVDLYYSEYLCTQVQES